VSAIGERLHISAAYLDSSTSDEHDANHAVIITSPRALTSPWRPPTIILREKALDGGDFLGTAK